MRRTDRAETEHRVGDPRYRRAHPTEKIGRGHEAIEKRHPVDLVAGGVELGLERRQIDVGRALGAAGLARQAARQHLGELRRSQRVGAETALESRPDGVGPAAGRVGLVSGGGKGRAHGRRLFQTAAAAVALLEVGDERLVSIDKTEFARELGSEGRADPEAEIAVDDESTRVDDLARVHEPLRIEEALELACGGGQLRSEVFLEELGAGDPDPMLGGEGTAELTAQGRNFVGDEPQPFDVLHPVQIEHRSDVELARGGVAVVRGLETEGSENGLEPVDIGRELIGSDADILDARGRLCRSRTAGQQRQPGLAQRPDELLSFGIRQHEPTIAETGLVERGEPLVDIVEELHQEQRFARV